MTRDEILPQVLDIVLPALRRQLMITVNIAFGIEYRYIPREVYVSNSLA